MEKTIDKIARYALNAVITYSISKAAAELKKPAVMLLLPICLFVRPVAPQVKIIKEEKTDDTFV